MLRKSVYDLFTTIWRHRNTALASWDLTVSRKHLSEETDANRTQSSPQSKLELFEEVILPHLDAAHNLARWFTRNEGYAQDVVQESFLRAFRFFDGYKGGNGKAWLLAIVRNTCQTWLRRQNHETEAVQFDEATHLGVGRAPDQERSAIQTERMGVLRSCIEHLPVDFREVLIMRELEEMSYQEIAEATGLALGTVMSRLSRARKRLEECAATRTMGAAG
jgi:RNA polymerase sigma-70 factor (ECF subfamily)